MPDTPKTPAASPQGEMAEARRLGGRPACGKRRGESLLAGGFVLLMLGLVAFAVYQCARHLTVNINTLRTQEITDTAYSDLVLYLFRDEETVTAGGGNVFLYGVRDGEKVGVGKTLGSAYVTMDGDAVAALQTRLDLLNDRIRLLENGGSGSSGATAALQEAERQYRATLAAVAAGSLSGTAERGEALLAALDAYRTQAGGGGSSAGASVLRQERDSLVSGLTLVGKLSAARAGWFCYTTDGLEAVFTPARAQSMTADEFRALTEQADGDRETDAYGIAGKLVCGSLWYAGALVPSGEAERFKTGRTYRVRCGDAAGSVLSLTCLRNEPAGEQALLVFSSPDMPDGFAEGRRMSVQTVLDTVSGYRIPTGALVSLPSPTTGEDVTGVYILSGNRVVFRRVCVLAERNGYVIVMTSGQAQAALEDETADPEVQSAVAADGWSFLKLNDRIITGGRNLYEGKVIA